MNYPDPRWDRSRDGSVGRPPDVHGQFHGMQLASWGWRVGAGVVDWGLFAIPYGVLGAINEWFGFIVAFGIMAFNSGYLAHRTGQSLGKKLLGIRMHWSIERPDGTYDLCFVPLAVALVRIPVHVLDYAACFSGFFAPIWTVGKGTYADYICRTVNFRDERLAATVRPVVYIGYGRVEYPGERAKLQ